VKYEQEGLIHRHEAPQRLLASKLGDTIRIKAGASYSATHIASRRAVVVFPDCLEQFNKARFSRSRMRSACQGSSSRPTRYPMSAASRLTRRSAWCGLQEYRGLAFNLLGGLSLKSCQGGTYRTSCLREGPQRPHDCRPHLEVVRRDQDQVCRTSWCCTKVPSNRATSSKFEVITRSAATPPLTSPTSRARSTCC